MAIACVTFAIVNTGVTFRVKALLLAGRRVVDTLVVPTEARLTLVIMGARIAFVHLRRVALQLGRTVITIDTLTIIALLRQAFTVALALTAFFGEALQFLSVVIVRALIVPAVIGSAVGVVLAVVAGALLRRVAFMLRFSGVVGALVLIAISGRAVVVHFAGVTLMFEALVLRFNSVVHAVIMPAVAGVTFRIVLAIAAQVLLHWSNGREALLPRLISLVYALATIATLAGAILGVRALRTFG